MPSPCLFFAYNPLFAPSQSLIITLSEHLWTTFTDQRIVNVDVLYYCFEECMEAHILLLQQTEPDAILNKETFFNFQKLCFDLCFNCIIAHAKFA